MSNAQIQRWRGSFGAFAIDPGNGSAMGVLDATTATGPYMLDEVAQNAAVKSYFITAGVPQDQIAGVHATFFSSGAAPATGFSSSSVNQQNVLESINSILTRSINGIPVLESTAWAKMRTTGDVDMEMVFWPPIDNSIVSQATTLATQLKDVTAHTNFVSKLPGPVQREIGVVIHHTDASIHSTPIAYAGYDAVIGTDANGPAMHFDITGARFVLPQEQRVDTSTSRP